jgi:ribonuclease-3
MSGSIKDLQRLIGHDFKDLSLLEMALTHSSTGKDRNYERLEFLGDRVLGVSIAEFLYTRFPDEDEGDLAKRLSALVQGSFLAKIAQDIELGQYINFSDAEREAGGPQNDHILADVFEGILGALYLDAGLAPCQEWIKRLWKDDFFTMEEPPQHPKTELQERAQSKGLDLPTYKIVRQSGPDHAPVFDVRLSVEGYEPIMAQGRSRQEAEKSVAQAFLDKNNL